MNLPQIFSSASILADVVFLCPETLFGQQNEGCNYKKNITCLNIRVYRHIFYLFISKMYAPYSMRKYRQKYVHINNMHGKLPCSVTEIFGINQISGSIWW